MQVSEESSCNANESLRDLRWTFAGVTLPKSISMAVFSSDIKTFAGYFLTTGFVYL